MPTRLEIVALARAWIGTPYVHQAATLGAGADCVGLVRGIWRALYGCEPEPPVAYGRDWAEATREETLLATARRHLVEIAPASVRAGDILVFRFRPRAPAKHVAIVVEPSPASPGAGQAAVHSIVHALEGAAVVEVPLDRAWRRRIAAAFAFPGVTD
jgi:NlpC/P60 family putative phage cell wall peptidase